MAPLAAPLRLLLVDDHPMMRGGIKALLETEADFEVAGEAENGAQAVKLAAELDVDVIIMDVSLPELGGAAATRQILEAKPSQRVLAISAHDDVGVARTLLGAGAAGYIRKRSAGEELLRAVRIVAAGGSYVDPTLADVVGLSRSAPRRGDGPVAAVSLSEREAEVLALVARGHSSKEVAEQLGISPRTLETYKERGMVKLGLHSRADLVRYAVLAGLLGEP